MSEYKGWIWSKPLSLPGVGTSGRFDIDIPRAARFMAVLNGSGAVLAYSKGTNYAQPLDAILTQPYIYIGMPIDETQNATMHWSTPSPLGAGANQAVVLFSNEPIIVSGGPMTTGGIASNVTVTGTPTVNINTMPNVVIASMPALPVGANHIGEVAVNTMPIVHVIEDTAANPPNLDATISSVVTAVNGVKTAVATAAQAATSGIISGSQIAVATTATILFSGVVSGRTINIQNFDTVNKLYLGPATVTNANGGLYVGPNGGVFSLDVIPGSTIVIYGAGSAALTAGISVIN